MIRKDEFYAVETKKGNRAFISLIEYDERFEPIVLESTKDVLNPQILTFASENIARKFCLEVRNDVNTDNPSPVKVSIDIRVGEA